MASYHETHGRLPPAVVYGQDGRPLYSWRVLLLPLIESQDLYGEFKLNEPWDSAHNIKLVPRMPAIFAPPRAKSDKASPGHTFIHVFVGKGTAFEDPQGGHFNDFTDGLMRTILLVEGGEPIPWTKPESLSYATEQPLPELATLFNRGFRVALANGNVRFLKKNTSEATLRALISRNGGESLGEDW